MNFFEVGDSAVCVEFGPQIDVQLNQKAIDLAHFLECQRWSEILEIVPTYSAVTVYFNPLKISALFVIGRLKEAVGFLRPGDFGAPRLHQIPVAYGGELGPDLEEVARLNQITADEVVKVHTETHFRVFMLGFMPGFPYCGIVPERIRAPRLSSPRTRIPAGSVGIAASQTGIYPMESPGGWRLIGRTPVTLFNPSADEAAMFRFKPGDQIQFYSISSEEFHGWSH
jgi:inhibitor of KinA